MGVFVQKNDLFLGIFHYIFPRPPPNERQWKKIIFIFPIPIPIPLHLLISSVFRSTPAKFPPISYIHPSIFALSDTGPKRLKGGSKIEYSENLN